MSLIFLLLGISLYGYFYRRYGDWLNPPGIFLFIWFITSSISCIDYDDFMKPWCGNMYLVTIISGFSFLIGSLCNVTKFNKFRIKSSRELNPSFYSLFYLSFIISFLCFLFEWYKSGFPTIFNVDNSIGGDMKTQLGMTAIPVIHYGTLLFPYLALFSFYSIINTSLKKRKIIMIMSFSIIILTSFLTKMSRGDLVIVLLGSIFIYSRYNPIKTKHICVFFTLGFCVFIGIAIIRLNEGGIVLSMSNNPYWSIIYSYTATCYANLNDLIINNYDIQYSSDATLSFLWTILGLKDSADVIEIEQIGIFNARTYLYAFYHDYKFLGITFFPFLIGLIITKIYIQSLSGNSLWNLLTATFQKAIWTNFFGNYFFGELVTIFPYLFTLLFIVIASNYKSIKIFSFHHSSHVKKVTSD